MDGIPVEAISDLKTPDYESIMNSIQHSDAVIIATDICLQV
jgi:starch synthase